MFLQLWGGRANLREQSHGLQLHVTSDPCNPEAPDLWDHSQSCPGVWERAWKLTSFPHIFVVQSLSRVQLFVTPWSAARQASLSFTISQSLLKLLSIDSMMPSNHLILCGPLLLLPSIFPNIRVFSNESALHIRWPKYWSFSFNISPSNEYSGLISFRKITTNCGKFLNRWEYQTTWPD